MYCIYCIILDCIVNKARYHLKTVRPVVAGNHCIFIVSNWKGDRIASGKKNAIKIIIIMTKIFIMRLKYTGQ